MSVYNATNSVTNSNTERAIRTINYLREYGTEISKSTVEDTRAIDTQSAATLITIADLHAGVSATTSINKAIESAIRYISPAQEAMEEVTASLQEALELANSASNPALVSNLSLLDGLYSSVLNRIAQTVLTTHDAAGNQILSGVIGNYNPAASSNVALILADAPTIQATNATNANTALQAIGGLNLSAATKLRLNAAATTSSLVGGVASTLDYLAKAMSIIPNIGIDPTQINAALIDAKRAAQIGALLGQAVANAVFDDGPGGAAGTTDDLLARMMAHILNEPIAANSVTQIGADAPPAGGDATNAAAIAALLTSGEKQAIRNYAASGLLTANTADEITGNELRPILGLITCFQNVTNLLGPNAGDILDAVDVGDVDHTEVLNAAAIGTLSKYILNAVSQRITNAKPQTVQIGRLPTDTLSIQINPMFPSDLGLTNTNILRTCLHSLTTSF